MNESLEAMTHSRTEEIICAGFYGRCHGAKNYSKNHDT